MPPLTSAVATEIATGDLVTLTELAHQQRTSPSSALRWVQRGLPDGRGGRTHLEAIRRGKRWLTSTAAIARFFSSLQQSEGRHDAPILPRSASKRERDVARAKIELKAHGF